MLASRVAPRLPRAMRALFFAFSLLASVATATDYRPVLLEHAQRYPQLEVQDCYKLLFQAVLGAEHAVTDEAGARRWMEKELATLGDGPAEPLIDPLTPDGVLVRVHLRTFLARRGDPVRLVRAFALTAQKKFGGREELSNVWIQVVALAEEKRLPFSVDAVRDFGEKMRTAGWPAVHHSTAFAAAYRPAYRVVAREFLPAALPRGE